MPVAPPIVIPNPKLLADLNGSNTTTPTVVKSIKVIASLPLFSKIRVVG